MLLILILVQEEIIHLIQTLKVEPHTFQEEVILLKSNPYQFLVLMKKKEWFHRKK